MKLLEQIRQYSPYNQQEQKDKELFLRCIAMHDDILTRDNPVVHITSSAFLVNKSRTKVLMVYHNIYNSWSWTGGHADGDADLLGVALKEAKEETGVKHVVPVAEDIFALDVLTVLGHIKKDSYVSAHLHLSVSYLCEADEKEELTIKEDENSGVAWIPIDELAQYCSEPHMMKVYNKLIAKMRGIFIRDKA